MFWNSIFSKNIIQTGVWRCIYVPVKYTKKKTFRDYFLTLFMIPLIFLQEKKRQDIKTRDKRTHYAQNAVVVGDP